MKLVLLVLLCLNSCVYAGCSVNQGEDFYDNYDVWKKVSISQMRGREMVDIEGNKVLFGHLNSQWLEFEANYSPGDCIVYFETVDYRKPGAAGFEGYNLIKDGEIVDVIYTGVR